MILPQDLLEIISPTGQVEFYPLSRGGLTRLGPHSSNQHVIAAPFQAMLDHRQQPYHFVLLSQAGEAVLNGQPLLAQTPTPLTPESIIQLAGYTLILLNGEPTHPQSPLPAENLSKDPECKASLAPPALAEPIPALPSLQIPSGRPRSWRKSSYLPHPRPGLWPLLGSCLIWLSQLGLIALIAFVIQANLAQWQAGLRLAEAFRTTPATPKPQVKAMSTPDFGQPHAPASSLTRNPVDRSNMTYEQIFQEIAPQYNLDWRLLAQLAYRESRLNRWAIGRDNDLGLMQILPTTWDEWAPQVGVTDPFDPYSNVLVGAAYLAYLRDYSQQRGYSEPYWMLVGYNWGPNNLGQLFAGNGSWAQVPEKQRRYVLAIMQTPAGVLDLSPDDSDGQIDIVMKN